MLRKLLVAITIMSLLLSECAPSAVTQAPAIPAEPTTVPVIEFFTWAEDDFEQASLTKLVESFQTKQNVRVNLEMMR